MFKFSEKRRPLDISQCNYFVVKIIKIALDLRDGCPANEKLKISPCPSQ
jgi:hypothetical protein